MSQPPNHKSRPSPASKRLIVFTRYPEAGRTKTRLVPSLGEEGAADVQRSMTEFILSRLADLKGKPGIEVEIRYAGGTRRAMRAWLGDGYRYAPQADGDLARRMGGAFEQAFNDGVRSAVLIGSDIPGITSRIIGQAFRALADSDLVFGPAADGGYYLIGLNRTSFPLAIPQVMTGISWGSSSVLRQTLRICDELGLKHRLVDVLRDVDRPDDLPVWEKARGAALDADRLDRISVVIPTLNEESNLLATLNRVMLGDNVEAIVVDGGSDDDTVDIAQSLGARVIHSCPPRAFQMNTGAGKARGSILLFLHADTLLPDNYDIFARRTLRMPGVAAGAFELRINSLRPSLRIMEKVANFRSRCLRRPYGDQACFVTAHLFAMLGGFPQMPIMEDYEFIRRLSRHGKIAVVPRPVTTSARRWHNVGIWRTWMLNQLLITAYHMGVSPRRLARWYSRESGVKERS